MGGLEDYVRVRHQSGKETKRLIHYFAEEYERDWLLLNGQDTETVVSTAVTLPE